MSSLICEAGKCIFTRIDTNDFAGGYQTGFPNTFAPSGTLSTPVPTVPPTTMAPSTTSPTTPSTASPTTPGTTTATMAPSTMIPVPGEGRKLGHGTSRQDLDHRREQLSTSLPTTSVPSLPTTSVPSSSTPSTFYPTFPPQGVNATTFPTYATYPPTGSGTFDTIAPWTDPTNQDLLSETVSLTRDFRYGIFNAKQPDLQYLGPAGTEWAFLPRGQTLEEARCGMQFCNWRDCFEQGNPRNMIGKPGVVHLMNEDVYYNIQFLNWTFDPPLYDEYGNEIYTPEDYLGGGFSYERDEVPISFPDDLPECPNCLGAKANPDIIDGPLDDSFVTVGIENVGNNVSVAIQAVSQKHNPRCNSAVFTDMDNVVRPNAKLLGDDTVSLRRTRVIGELTPVRYTIFFSATNEAGTCMGNVSVCVPPIPGFTCDETQYDTYDATATRVCPS